MSKKEPLAEPVISANRREFILPFNRVGHPEYNLETFWETFKNVSLKRRSVK